MPHAAATASILGLAIGDALGATSEFAHPQGVPELMRRHPEWPRRLVGGGQLDWPAGAPTDDTEMALCLLRSLRAAPSLDVDDLAARFVAWMQSGPRDIGATIRRTLNGIAGGRAPHQPARADYRARPNNASNGSLMRNGVVGAVVEDLHTALDVTVCQSAVTHYAPLPVVCCALQTMIIHDAVHGEATAAPDSDALRRYLSGAWLHWRAHTADPRCRQWLTAVGSDTLDAAQREVFKALRGFERFDPYRHNYKGRSGYCVLTLRIALWALHWALETPQRGPLGRLGRRPPRPPWLPSEPFEARGFDTLAWVALIGADADTYGAVAGALLGAYCPDIPARYLDNLAVRDEIEHLAVTCSTSSG